MYIPTSLYEYLPEAYTLSGTTVMLLFPSTITVFVGVVLVAVGVTVWRARKNYRFEPNPEITKRNVK